MMFRYLVYFLQFFILIFLLIGYFILDEINKDIQKKYLEIRREKIEFQDVRKKLLILKEKIKEYKLEPVNSSKAETIILSKADKLYKLFNAQMVKDLSVENNLYRLQMELKIPLDNKRKISSLLYTLESSKMPIINIKRIEIENNSGTYILKLGFELIQIFKG